MHYCELPSYNCCVSDSRISELRRTAFSRIRRGIIKAVFSLAARNSVLSLIFSTLRHIMPDSSLYVARRIRENDLFSVTMCVVKACSIGLVTSILCAISGTKYYLCASLFPSIIMPKILSEYVI